MLDTNELRNLSRQELQDKVAALKKSLFDMNCQKKTSRLEKPGLVREARRNIARILTILNEIKLKRSS